MKTTNASRLSSAPQYDIAAWYYWLPVILVSIGAFFIPFSPALNSLIAVTSLWCLGCPPIRCQLGRIIKQPVCWFALLFLLWIAIRCFGGVPMSWHLKLWQLKHMISWFAPVLLLPVLFVKARYRALVWLAVLVSGSLIAALQLAVFFSAHFDLSWYAFFSRVLVSLSLQPQQASVFLAFTAYLYALIACGACDKKSIRWAALLAVLLIGLSLVAGQAERVGLVVCVLALLFLVYRRFKLRWLMLLCFSFMLIVCSAVLVKPDWINGRFFLTLHNLHSYVINRDNERLAPRTSVGMRLYYVKQGTKLFLHKPLIGYGAGSFRGGGVAKAPDPTFGGYHGTAENNYLTMALQLGLIGLMLFIGFLVSLWRLGARLPVLERDILYGMLVISTLAAMSFVAFSTNNISMLFAAVVASCLGSDWGPLTERVD